MNLQICYNEKAAAILFAGHELQEYLTRMDPSCVFQPQGSRCSAYPITFRIEQSSSSLDDRYQIIVSEKEALLAASNPRSILLAVYRLLTELGCRFLGPGKCCEYIPAASLTAVQINITEKASFRHRGICIEGADSLDNILEFIDWLPKAGFNAFFLQHKNPGVFLDLWYQHKLNPLAKKHPLSKPEQEDAFRQIDDAIAIRGIIHHRAGHGWTSGAMQFDKPCQKAPAGLLERVQPLLAMIDGKRCFFHGIPSNTNLCYSSQAAVNAFTNSVVSYACQHPEVDYLHVWLADEYNNVCECEECQKTTLSDQYLELLNLIDRKLTEKGADTRIVLLLYQELLWPPLTARIYNPDRFVLMFAPISRTFESSYCQATGAAPIPNYRRNQIKLPNSLEKNLAFLAAWKEKYPNLDSFVYDYPLGRAHYGDLGYLHIAKIIYDDIRYLHRLNLNGYLSCQELRAALPNSFPNYVMGKLLWNQNLDFKELQREYFSAAYGTGSDAALNYLQCLSRLSSCDYFNGIGNRINPQAEAGFREITRLAEAFQPEAHRIAQSSKGIAETYWQRLDYHSAYSILLSKALAALATGDEEKAQKFWHSFANTIRSREPEYQACLDVYRIIEVATRYTGFTLDI